MTRRTRELLDEFLRLTPQERVEFAAVVLDALDHEVIDPTWITECRRRLDRFRADGVAIPWTEVQTELDARSRRRSE